MTAYHLAGLLLCAVALLALVPACLDARKAARSVESARRAEVGARLVACRANENARWVG